MQRRTFLGLLASVPTLAYAIPTQNDFLIDTLLADEAELFARSLLYGRVARENYDALEQAVLGKVGKLDGADFSAGVRILNVINETLEEQGYTWIRPRTLLTRCLVNKTLDCDTGTFLYMSLGQRVNMNTHYVLVFGNKDPKEGHAFARIHFAKGTTLNWETTNGKPYSNQEIIDDFGTPPESIKRGAFLRSLSLEEALGAHDFEVAKEYKKRGIENGAQFYLERARVRNPKDVLIPLYQAYMVLTVMKGKRKHEREVHAKQVIPFLHLAEQYAPDFVTIPQCLARLYHSIGDKEKERVYRHRAIYYDMNLTEGEKTKKIKELYRR